MNHRLHLTISGRVQGVCFRAYTQDEANKLGLTGWVRNLPDGRVEVVAEGLKKTLEELKQWCLKGPPLAKVSHIQKEWLPVTGEFKVFRIGY